jgi:dsDNA-specific endonuclease/ATPase MutS2
MTQKKLSERIKTKVFSLYDYISFEDAEEIIAATNELEDKLFMLKEENEHLKYQAESHAKIKEAWENVKEENERLKKENVALLAKVMEYMPEKELFAALKQVSDNVINADGTHD